jgi:hypothetical protein
MNSAASSIDRNNERKAQFPSFEFFFKGSDFFVLTSDERQYTNVLLSF